MAHRGLSVVPRTAVAVGEGAHRPSDGTAELGRALLALAHEQTRHQLELLRALADAVDWDTTTRVVDWDQVVQLQGEILRRSQARTAQLSQRYLELTQAVTTAAAAAAQRRANQAA